MLKTFSMMTVLALVSIFLVATATADSTKQVPQAKSQTEANDLNKKFEGWGFGAGLTATYDTGDRDRVEEASIDANGIVRVDKTDNTPVRLMLETHYFFPYRKLEEKEVFRRGWGPFVAVLPGEKELIDAAGIGVMFGWRRVPLEPEPDKEYSTSFNLGIGYVLDPSTKVLGAEFREGEPAPLDPDGEPIPIRMQTRDQGGWMLVASFSW